MGRGLRRTNFSPSDSPSWTRLLVRQAISLPPRASSEAYASETEDLARESPPGHLSECHLLRTAKKQSIAALHVRLCDNRSSVSPIEASLCLGM